MSQPSPSIEQRTPRRALRARLPAPLCALFSLWLLACAARPEAPAQHPTAATTEAPPTASSPPPSEAPTEEQRLELPPPPASCERYRTAPEARQALGGAGCPSPQAFRESLAQALDATADARDAALAALTGCGLPVPGWVTALRAELAEPECADAIVRPALEGPVKLRADLSDSLKGLALAAQLSRLVRDPPRIEQPSKEQFEAYFKDQLTPWIFQQAHAVHRLSQSAARLAGYGRAVAAVEAGIADMRFVEVVREVPLPTAMAADAGLSEAYYGALDQALEPRKARGRDAALAGLDELGALGVLASPRVERARSLLSNLYGGRRIDALDALLLPALPAYRPDSTNERLLVALPAFYSAILLDDVNPTDPRILRAMLAQGLGERARRVLDSTPSSQETATLYARALVRLGQLYWRSNDFVAAARVANLSPLGAQKTSDEARLLSALADALKRGPEDARQMMQGGPRYPEGLDDVAALDRLSAEKTALAGYAAFDAAHLASLVPPLADPRAAADNWRKIATRFELAARRLPDAVEKKVAQERAKGAREIANAVARPQPAAKPAGSAARP
jgi:hypothetical protein